MTLKSKLLLATTVAVLVVLAISASLSYQHTAAFLRQHEFQMRTERDHAALLEMLRVEKRDLLTSLAFLHVIHAAATVLALGLVLNLLWYRLFIRRIEILLQHINSMRLGTWTAQVPIGQDDEIGQLSRAFNELGEQLTMTVQQFATTSKLSAMALVGQGVVRKALLIADHVEAVQTMVDQARSSNCETTEFVSCNLKEITASLREIPGEFEAAFARQFGLYSVPHTIEPTSRSRVFENWLNNYRHRLDRELRAARGTREIGKENISVPLGGPV